MSITVKEKTTSPILDEKAIEYKIEIATQTLERNIGFVTNCDSKASIVLAVFGGLLAIVLTNEGLKKIFCIIESCIETKNFCSISYLLYFVSSMFILGLGMFNLGRVLVAKTSEEISGRKEADSHIFFAGIKKVGDCKNYKQQFCDMSKEELLNDLIEQIYINAEIASFKYNTYNVGLRYTIIGFVLFVSLLLIGIYIYWGGNYGRIRL